MQVGDLVELSSAGSKAQQNWEVVGKIGLLMKIQKHASFPYQVQWYGVEKKRNTTIREGGILPMKRYELKRLKCTKK